MKRSPHATSWDRKKLRNLLGQKNHATSRDQKIVQPLGTKQSRNILGQRKSRNLLRQKNDTTLRDKKITQPLGTKKRLHNLSGQKNHPLSRDHKKIMQPLGTTKNRANSLKFLSGYFEFVTVYLGLVFVLLHF